MNWVVGVEVAESSTDDAWQVSQGAILLTEDEQRPGRWVLTQPLDGFELDRGDGNVLFSFPSEPFRIFKLVGPERDRGRHLKSLTRGRFLIVTSLEWKRDAGSAGHEIVAPEYVVGASYRAHHLELSDPLAGSVVFDTPSGHVELPMQSPGFDLQGDRLADAHPEAGPLFHSSPPQLRSSGNIAYRTVVIGEEGPREGTPGWRAHATDFKELRPRITARGAGWFFVRLYDSNDELIESLDFRFCAGLHAIEPGAVPPLPGEDGHPSARFRVVLDPDWEIIPTDASANGQPLVTREEDDSYHIEIPPLPDRDEMRWSIRNGKGAKVEVCLRVDRLWWLVEDEDSEPGSSGWTDRKLELRTEDLAATSRRVLRVRLPTASFAKEVRVGVQPDRCLALRPIAGRPRQVCRPLRDFGRFIGRAPLTNIELKLWLPADGGQTWEAAVARICAPERNTEPEASRDLCLQALKPPRVMTMLTRVRHRCSCFRHKRMIEELRRAHYNPGRHNRHRDRARREEFLRRALCLLAVIIEEHALSKDSPLVPARWAHRAQLAREALPDLFEAAKAGR